MIPGSEISRPQRSCGGSGPFQAVCPSQVGMYGVEAQGAVYFFFFFLIYLFLSRTGSSVAARAFSSGAEQGLLFVVVRGFLEHRLSSGGAGT